MEGRMEGKHPVVWNVSMCVVLPIYVRKVRVLGRLEFDTINTPSDFGCIVYVFKLLISIASHCTHINYSTHTYTW